MRKLFINSREKRLRSGWRILIFLLFYVLLSRIFGNLSLKLSGKLDRSFYEWWVWRGFVVIAASTISVWLCRIFIDRKKLVTLGLQFNRNTLYDFLFGLGVSGLMITTIFMIYFFTGILKIESVGWDSFKLIPFLEILFWFFGIGLAIGWSEELTFRGYLLQNLAEGSSIVIAVAVSMLLYGLLHMSNPGSTLLTGSYIAMIGFIRIFGWLRTRQLWLSIGMHAGWDFFMGPILGFPVSGMKTQSVFEISVEGTNWITGGEFGPEAGILMVPALLLGLSLMYWYTRKRLK